MSENRDLVVLITCGLDDEKMSVAWSISNGAISSGLDVTVFLTAAAVDSVRKGAADKINPNPLDPPVGEMIRNLMSNGGKVLVCPPCAKVRGYSEDDLLDGIVITGSAAIHTLIQKGAATLSF